MIEWLIEFEGFKLGVDHSNEHLSVLINPNEIPNNLPSFRVYTGHGHLPIGGMSGEFILGEGYNFINNEVTLITGDSFLQLDRELITNNQIDGFEFVVRLVPNEFKRLGKILIDIPNINGTFEQKNSVMF